MDWPLRAKMAALLTVASVLPLGIAAAIDIREARQRLAANTAALLAARGDQLRGELDAFHRGYQRSAARFSRLPDVVEFCRAGESDDDRLRRAVRGILDVQPASDANVRGVAVLDPSGTVTVATESQLVGRNLAYHSYVREALGGAAVVSDIHLAESQVGYAPTIAYLAPVRAPDQKVIGLVAIWVRAASLWEVAKASNELAGPGSFAVLFDQLGIRIAHTYNQDIIFHPGGRLDPATVDALVAERRFGEKTRELLDDVRAFPEQFDRALALSPDQAVFRGFAPVNQQWNYGVGRRFATVPWTVFYMIPEASLQPQIVRMTRDKTVFAGVIILIALVAGSWFAVVALKPIGALSKATDSIARGELAARVKPGYADELGRLGVSFNAMAGRIEAQTSALREAHDDLEQRVQERTQELRESEQSLATTLNSIGDAVIATDMEGRVVRMNPVAERLTGWALEEARGQPLHDVFRIVDEDTRRPVDSPVARVLREGVVIGLANHTVLIARNGSERPIADSGAPIQNPAGGISGVVLVFRDQTEERKIEEVHKRSFQLESRNLRIEEGSRLKSEFLANMSHELRTPLNAIIGFAELMHRGKVGPVSAEHEEYLGDILTSSKHLLHLINDVLDLAKIESGKMEFRPESVDLATLAREVCDILRGLAASRRLQVETHVDPEVATVIVDPARVKQILYNYLSNAIKFTPSGGRVSIRFGPEGSDLFRIDVEDTGVGIAAGDLGRLFVEFQQLDASAAKEYQGTGLGLALTKKLAEAHGGRVTVRSTPGEGSTFTAILPRVMMMTRGGHPTVPERQRLLPLAASAPTKAVDGA
jgi:PAS domain S-box-containing protein